MLSYICKKNKKTTEDITMIRVESDVLSERDLFGKRNRVRELEAAGYSNMAIMHFMAEKNSVTGVYENGNFVIMLS